MGAFDGFRYGYGGRVIPKRWPSASEKESKPTRSELVTRASKMKKPDPKFDFGKYKGKTVSAVMEINPHYILWCWENFDRRSRLPFTETTYRLAKQIVEEQDPNDDDFDDLDAWALSELYD
jgi:hypothetical protein